MIGNHSSGKEEKDKPYFIDDMLIDMIVETEKPKGVEIVFRDVNI